MLKMLEVPNRTSRNKKQNIINENFTVQDLQQNRLCRRNHQSTESYSKRNYLNINTREKVLKKFNRASVTC